MVEVAGPPFQKKIIFCPQNYSFGCTLMQFLTGRKWIFTRSLGTRILRFNLEMMITKRCKNYPEIHGQTGGGGRTMPPPFNTPLEAGTLVRILIRYQFRALGYGQFTRTLCSLLGEIGIRYSTNDNYGQRLYRLQRLI